MKQSPTQPKARQVIFVGLGVLILLGAWALLSLGKRRLFIPAPWTTCVDTAILLSQSLTWTQILITFFRVCVGFAGGYVVGVLCGVAMGARRELSALLRPVILFLQGMPPLLWAIPLVVVMGIGHLPAILVIALVTLPVVAVTVQEGMASLPRSYGEMLQVFAPGVMPRVRELVLPHLRPFLMASLNLGIVLAVKASVTAEYFTANNGIGFQIQSAYQSLQVRRLFSWAVVLVLIILASNYAAARIASVKPRSRRAATSAAFVPVTSMASRPRPSGVALSGVGFGYRPGSALLRDVSLSVSPEEIAVITGDSGVGKTTLLKLVASLLRPSHGEIKRPERIGVVFQDERLLPWRSVVANTALPLVYQGVREPEALALAASLLEEVGLDGHGEKSPDQLSGGMRKRAALARCFARLPDLILLDEPFGGLHRDARRQLWEKLLRLRARRPVPVILVTHYPEETAAGGRCTVYELKGSPATLMKIRGARRVD